MVTMEWLHLSIDGNFPLGNADQYSSWVKEALSLETSKCCISNKQERTRIIQNETGYAQAHQLHTLKKKRTTCLHGHRRINQIVPCA